MITAQAYAAPGGRTPRGGHHRDEVLTGLNKARCQRGHALFRSHSARILCVGPFTYRVPSQNGGGLYHVSLAPGAEHCTCPDYARHGRRRYEPGEFSCKHLYAALLYQIKSAAALTRTEAA